jgi:TetR/AcrR family transcriptional regulator, transcriptional repressor for nem operon
MSSTRRKSRPPRQEILEAVAPFLKRHGKEGAPVDALMKVAGLTSGALYSQFKNKDDLCSQAICSALDAMLAAYGSIVHERGREGLRSIVSSYLSSRHAVDVAGGCTFTALGSDMAKASPRTRQAYEARIHALVEIFAEGLGLGSEAVRRAKAQHILSTMLGGLTFARAMSDPGAQDEFLAQLRSGVLREIPE